VYKALALTAIHPPFAPAQYVYFPTLIPLGVFLVAIFIAFFTRFGRTIYAIGNNEQSAMLMGLPVARTKIIVYAFSGFCVALGGIVLVFRCSRAMGNLQRGWNWMRLRQSSWAVLC
jgi:ribose/xylose/arabinose/galactoside ABC-type transport system permease subunit